MSIEASPNIGSNGSDSNAFDPEDVFGGETYEEFLESPKSEVEFVGDLHSNDARYESDIENYANALMEKYSPEDELKGIVMTGDLATNLGATQNMEELLEKNPGIVHKKAQEYVATLSRSRQTLEEVNDYFENDIEILVKEGNHTTTRGAHGKDADQFSEIVEQKAAQMIDDFEEYDGSFDQFVFESSESIDLVNYDARKIGDTTYVFGGKGWENEIDPLVLEHGTDMLYSEEDFETKQEEWTSLLEQENLFGDVARKLGPIGNVLDKAYDVYKSATAPVEEYLPDENMNSEHIEYGESLEKLEEAYVKAADLGGENTVFVSHQGPNSQLEEEYTIDEHDRQPCPQGSVAEAKFLEDKDIDGILVGHHHSGETAVFNEMPVLNLGAGQSSPGISEDLTSAPVYGPEDIPDFQQIKKLDQIEEEGFDNHYQGKEEELESVLENALENDEIEENEMEQQMEQHRQQLNAERRFMEGLSSYRDERTAEPISPETPDEDYALSQAAA